MSQSLIDSRKSVVFSVIFLLFSGHYRHKDFDFRWLLIGSC